MRHRIYTPDPFAPGDRIAIRGDELHHAARVVRVREGEEAELFDGKGLAARGVITAVQNDQLTVNVLTIIDARETRLSVTLAMSIIALDKFELVLQKATELGVRSIVPIVTERVEIRPERYRGKQERWERIVFEAVKQSGRARTPQLESPLPFAEAIERPGTRVLFDADVEPSPPLATPSEAETLFIGPEGGWSEHELELAHAAGAHFRRLGARRLRAETAAIVALSRTFFESGDLG
ncbi:MAG TPA: RsmE family RNA methyltransferase [Thermoanaerobaculia bacterium]|nr:RsmE family RNA methyltransferase [Thermoanaerobaculia bacterium]